MIGHDLNYNRKVSGRMMSELHTVVKSSKA